jgi:predicted DNA-binding protein with PD1-like motif
VGNISVRDDQPLLHAHATFAATVVPSAASMLGCEVFAAEVTIREMTGVELIRTPDEVTGLALW